MLIVYDLDVSSSLDELLDLLNSIDDVVAVNHSSARKLYAGFVDVTIQSKDAWHLFGVQGSTAQVEKFIRLLRLKAMATQIKSDTDDYFLAGMAVLMSLTGSAETV